MIYFYLYSVGLASLVASTLTFDPPTTHTAVQLFNETGNRGDAWLYGQFNVSTLLEYQIVISAIIDPANWTGDVAIDDTALFAGFCGGTLCTTQKLDKRIHVMYI